MNSKHTGKPIDPDERGEVAPHEMTEAEKQARDDALGRVYRLLLQVGRERDLREFKWSERPMTWVKDETRNLWTCDRPPDRAIVFLKQDAWHWEVCIDRRAPAKSAARQFLRLEEAVVWAEEQLAAAAKDAEAEPGAQISPTPLSSRAPVDLEPYRIEPSALEPERITYQVIIDLYAAPERYKTMELLCGRQMRYDERYLSPGRLATELRIDEAEFEIKQPLGPNHGWHQCHSTVTYYRESVAVEQAQLMWSKSRIVEQYRKGRLLRARYGVKEVETGYRSWLGGCENPEQPWGKPQTRAEYLADKAEELTLAHALDVKGFREFIGWSREEVSDEQILGALHYKRAHSPAIPVAGRTESKRWLSAHPDWRA